MTPKQHNHPLRDVASLILTGKPYDMWQEPNTLTQFCAGCGHWYIPISDRGLPGKDYPLCDSCHP